MKLKKKKKKKKSSSQFHLSDYIDRTVTNVLLHLFQDFLVDLPKTLRASAPWRGAHICGSAVFYCAALEDTMNHDHRWIEGQKSKNSYIERQLDGAGFFFF